MITRPVDNDFAEWAFGADLWTDFLMWEKDCIDLLHAWNDRHGDLYRCHEEQAIEESMAKMKQLYEEKKNAKSKPSKAKRSTKVTGAKKASNRGTQSDSCFGVGAHVYANKVKPIRGTNG